MAGMGGVYFNPLPPHGGRLSGGDIVHSIPEFQSTPSAWRETVSLMDSARPSRISIHSLRMEGDPWKSIIVTSTTISIHSLRMEGDLIFVMIGLLQNHFNPLPPHGGRRDAPDAMQKPSAFQSTPSAWRETLVQFIKNTTCQISIHSLRMEGDLIFCENRSDILYFNPLPPHGGRRTKFVL